MDKNVSEIWIGQATYIVEREFAGTVSREELLIDKIVDQIFAQFFFSIVSYKRSVCGKLS